MVRTNDDIELSRITVEEILRKANIDEIDIEIFILRFGYEWSHKDIGEIIGVKYRNKIYTEGAIRYRIKNIRSTLDQYLIRNNLL